jgi:hypothetical protein
MTPIQNLNLNWLTGKQVNILHKYKVDSLEELVKLTEKDILRMEGFGKRSLEQIKIALDNEYGMSLRTKIIDLEYFICANCLTGQIKKTKTQKFCSAKCRWGFQYKYCKK